MSHWLYPANVKFYDVFAAFSAPVTYWPMSSKVSVGDVVYIYLAAPHKQIGFVCDVVEIDCEQDSILEAVRPFFRENQAGPSDNKKAKRFMKLSTHTTIALASHSVFSYHCLKENGLTGMLMGPRKLENNPRLLEYIKGSMQ